MEVEILSPNAYVCESTLHIIIGNAISSGERVGIAPIRRGLFDGFVVIGVADSFLGSFLFVFTSVVNDELILSTWVSFGDDDFGNTAAVFTVTSLLICFERL